MFCLTRSMALGLSLATIAGGLAQAAELEAKATKADLPAKATKKPPDLPFFFVIDNRATFSWMPKGTNPGVFSVRPDGTINGTTAKQVYSFTHFDAWAYGTNFFTISLFKSDHNDPANPCTNAGVIFNTGTGTATPANCAGNTDIFGLFRSTFGWNEIFNTKAFTMGPLRNVSFEVGMDAETESNYLAAAKRSAVAGLQFAFDLPYKGYFNVAPLAYWHFSDHNSYLQCGSGFVAPVPGVSCLADGTQSFKPTWAIETNYYMDLGFLPETMQFWSISGIFSWYGKKGSENSPLPGTQTAVELYSEPLRLTFDASKAVWGEKYAHFVDVWVAYRYRQNKFGLDHVRSSACNVSPGVSNNTCTESTVYSGITVKF